MQQRRHSRQRQRALIWVLSLLLFLSPLIGLAKWLPAAMPVGDPVAEMPCHQAGGMQPQYGCKHCGNAHALLTCDCCQSSLPPSLSMAHPRLVHIASHCELRNPHYNQFLPEPPPGFLYRPPIRLI
jgi:hypothetical protein